MNKKWLRYGIIAVALITTGFVLRGAFNSWVARKPAEPQDQTPPVVTLRPPDRIELMPPSSDESMRKHVFGENAREVRTDIYYKNGDMARTMLRPDGSIEEYRREDKDGKIIVLRKFDTDGTVIQAEEHREDGSLKVRISQSIDKMINTKVYWWDGKSVFSMTKQYPRNGSYETVYYRRSGSMSCKRTGPKPGVVTHEELWDKRGNLEYSRDHAGPKWVITVYRGGTASYRQTFVEEKTSWGSVSKKITMLEEFDSDGKTLTRKILYEVSQWYPSTIEVYKDGNTIVRKMRSDGTVETEETRDAGGTILDSKSYSSNDYVREDVEYGRTNEPYVRDPVYGWDLQEKYEYYRNQDD